MTITLIPEIQVDVEETKIYISKITEWIRPEKWACQYHHIEKTHFIYKSLVNQLSIGNPGSIFIMSIFPESNFQVHIDEIRNSAIIIPIDGDFHIAPVSFYRNLDGKEKILNCTYEIGSAVLLNFKGPHGVQNPSKRYRTTIMINIRNPHTYESVRAAYLNGTLLK